MKKIQSLLVAITLAAVAALSGCANLEQKATNVIVTQQPKEQVQSVAFIFIMPSKNSSTLANNFYQTAEQAGALNKKLIQRFSGRMVGFLNENSLQAKFIDAVPAGPDLIGMINELTTKGSHVVLCEISSIKVTTIRDRYGMQSIYTPVYRFAFLNTARKATISFNVELNFITTNSNFADTAGAAILNTLSDNGFIKKPTDKWKQPVYKDLFRDEMAATEDRKL